MSDRDTAVALKGLPQTNRSIYLVGGVGAGKTTALMRLLYGALQEVNPPSAALMVTPDVTDAQHLGILLRLHEGQKGVLPSPFRHVHLSAKHSPVQAREAFMGLLREGVVVAVEGAAYEHPVRRALASRILATGGRLLMVL